MWGGRQMQLWGRQVSRLSDLLERKVRSNIFCWEDESLVLNIIIIVTMGVCVLSHVWLFCDPWTVVHQVPLSMGFPQQEYWSRLLFSPPKDLPDPGTEPMSLASPALVGGFFTTAPPGKPWIQCSVNKCWLNGWWLEWSEMVSQVLGKDSWWYEEKGNFEIALFKYLQIS